MKTARLITLSLALSISAASFAQTGSKPPARTAERTESDGTPVVTIGTIDAPVTSREKVLAYPRLLAQTLNCEVTGFDFAMTANGQSWGPVTVKGPAFNEAVKDRIKETEPVNVKISITNIRVKCNGGDEVTAKPINVEYNH